MQCSLPTNIKKLWKTLRELNAESETIGFKLNQSKTKYMRLRDLEKEQTSVDGEKIEVEKYIYLGQEVNMRNNLEGEASLERRPDVAAFSSQGYIFKEIFQRKFA